MDFDDILCEELDGLVSLINELAYEAARSATTEEERQGVQHAVELAQDEIDECAERLREQVEALRVITRAFAQPRS